MPTNTHSEQWNMPGEPPFQSCVCRNPSENCRPRLVVLQLLCPLLLCHSPQGVQVGTPVVCMFRKLLSKAVVFVVRPASMETRLQHVVGIRKVYIYNCLFPLSKCTTTLWGTRATTTPTLWLLRARVCTEPTCARTDQLGGRRHYSIFRMPTFAGACAGAGTVDGAFAGAGPSGVGEEAFAFVVASYLAFWESVQSSRPSAPNPSKTKPVSLAALATARMFLDVVRACWLPASRLSRMLVPSSMAWSTVPSSSSTSS